MGKVHAVITLSSGQKVDNHVDDNLNETSESLSASSSVILPITANDAIESREDDPTDTVTIYPPKTTPTPPLQD